jgi:peptidoglycan/LPS O-acetylase OafA/YrhL
MGCLRLILALAVAIAHLPMHHTWQVYLGSHPIYAVRGFFIISGFYMAMVLTERAEYQHIGRFYVSRLLKLLPLYWAVSLAALGLHPDAWRSFDLASYSPTMLVYLFGSLATLFGSDTWVWLGFGPGGWSVAPAFAPYATSPLSFAAVPQAWTLGLELLFYALAPFIVRRRIVLLVGLVVASLAFRIVTGRYFGLHGEPWNRSLFPSELIFFLLGVLAYRATPYLLALRSHGKAVLALAAVVVACRLWFATTLAEGWLINPLQYVCTAAALPLLFALTRRKEIDARLGTLSYPLYLVHIPLYVIAGPGTGWWLIALLTFAIIAAWILEKTIAQPIDLIRARFGARARLSSPDASQSPVFVP